VATLVTGYGKKQVLNGVSLEVPRGKIVTLVGQNGAGKSTLLKAVIGLLPIWRGQVSLGGNVLHTPKPRDLLCAGVSYIPQGNRVFTHLTVRENLEVAGTTLPNKAQLRGAIDRALRLFTDLRPRMGQYAGTLSGGEKQMLALASALVLGPRLLLMDEPSLGLAPQLVERLLRHIWEINKESGVTVLIVEQKVREVLKIAHRVYVLRNGQVSFDGPTESLDDTKLREAYF
jgi:branched-chain amino acid transport system ATP-binding protein